MPCVVYEFYIGWHAKVFLYWKAAYVCVCVVVDEMN